MLKGKNIYKSFDNLEVLKDINIEIERGKIVSIVGKSGAGKSTLLYILSTLDKATNGEVLFDNKKLDELKGDDLSNFRNKKIGFIFQFHNLLSEFSVLENVSIPALISSSDKEKIKIILENINKNLSVIEKIKKFVLIYDEFTINNGMLTPTLKLKRKEIIKNYKKQLENLY